MNHNTICNVVHPQCRGYVHKTVFIQLFTTKMTVLICALSYRSFQSLKSRTQQQASAHTAADLPFHQKPLCAHSCRGHPRTQLGINLLTKNLIQSLIFALQ